jgi:hypothetical protein
VNRIYGFSLVRPKPDRRNGHRYDRSAAVGRDLRSAEEFELFEFDNGLGQQSQRHLEVLLDLVTDHGKVPPARLRVDPSTDLVELRNGEGSPVDAWS